MCGGHPDDTDPILPAQQPLPAPSPMPTPTSTNPITTEQQRVNQVANLKKGMLSTIKTSGQGTGKGAALTAPQGIALDTNQNKKLLGS